MKKETKKLAITMIAVLTLIVCVVGATYAYFRAQMGSGQSVNINANTATTDSLKFEDGKNLVITANQENFAEGAGNESDSTIVSAKLIANNTTNSATYNYNVYLDILNNELEYTTEEKTAELLLQIIDPEDNVVTTIPGLNYVTIGGVSGFDITEAKEIITIANNYEIKAEAAVSTAEKIDEWEVTLVLVNLDTDQNANMGKQFTAKVLIGQEKVQTLADVCQGQNMAECFKQNFQLESSIIHHNGTILAENGEVIDANDDSYRYAGGYTGLNELAEIVEASTGVYETYYYFKDDEQAESIERFLNIILKEDAWTDEETIYVEEMYEKMDSGELNLFYSIRDALEYAKVNGKKVTYEEVNNYVCFGSAAAICPDDNLYRIVGVFDNQVKLIKNTDIGKNYWSGSSSNRSNVWSNSSLNTDVLNGTYLSNLGTAWSDMIATTTWKVDGMKNLGSDLPKQYYDSEVGIGSSSTTYSAKIGLTYVSDYGYAAYPDAWSTRVDHYKYATIKRNNWMYLGSTELTISPDRSFSIVVYDIDSSGAVSVLGIDKRASVRPTFLLISSVILSDGIGTSTNPYRIRLEQR